MDEDFKWIKFDSVAYEYFLNIAVSSMPSGSLTTSDVVSPEDVHPTGKENSNGKD